MREAPISLNVYGDFPLQAVDDIRDDAFELNWFQLEDEILEYQGSGGTIMLLVETRWPQLL